MIWYALYRQSVTQHVSERPTEIGACRNYARERHGAHLWAVKPLNLAEEPSEVDPKRRGSLLAGQSLFYRPSEGSKQRKKTSERVLTPPALRTSSAVVTWSRQRTSAEGRAIEGQEDRCHGPRARAPVWLSTLVELPGGHSSAMHHWHGSLHHDKGVRRSIMWHFQRFQQSVDDGTTGDHTSKKNLISTRKKPFRVRHSKKTFCLQLVCPPCSTRVSWGRLACGMVCLCGLVCGCVVVGVCVCVGVGASGCGWCVRPLKTSRHK